MNEKKSKIVATIILVALLILFATLFVIKFFGPEDNWICEDGTWIKHGNPSSGMPTTPCESQVVGGDKDEHGCIGSAGYSWCEVKQKCLRSWEENCSN
ncbi:Uncharacterised protein [uncultured archaeon]|nr:Uncharacterised protein [uncultured archaeon]